MLSEDQEQEHRPSDEGGDHSDLENRRGQNDPSDEIGGEHEKRSEERGCGNEISVVGSYEYPGHMGRYQSDEAYGACVAHDGGRYQRHDDQADDPKLLGIDPQRLRIIVPGCQDVDLPGKEHYDDGTDDRDC